MRDGLRELLRILMINGEALRRLFESNSARCGEDPHLTHAAAKHFAIDAGFFDERVRADNHRTYGRAKTFRKAEHDGIDVTRDLRNGNAERDGRVEDACSVQVNFQSDGMGVIADVADLGGSVERSAGHIVRVFEADERGLRVVINLWTNNGFDLSPGEDAVFAECNTWHAASDRGHRS